MAGATMPLSAIRLDTSEGRELIPQFLALLVVAVIGKVAAGLTVPIRGINRLAVGIAMMPRGEVALVFAGFAIAAKIFTPQLYVVVLMVVMATTMITPPLLKAALRGRASSLPPAVEDDRDAAQAPAQPVPAAAL